MKKEQVTGRIAPALVTIREAVRRAKNDGMPVSEYALRTWIRQGIIPARKIGNRALLYYPSLLAFVCCDLNAAQDILQKEDSNNG